jgi:hypothetical protein
MAYHVQWQPHRRAMKKCALAEQTAVPVKKSWLKSKQINHPEAS